MAAVQFLWQFKLFVDFFFFFFFNTLCTLCLIQREVNTGISVTALKSSSQMLTLKSLKHDYNFTCLVAESGVERMD